MSKVNNILVKRLHGVYLGNMDIANDESYPIKDLLTQKETVKLLTIFQRGFSLNSDLLTLIQSSKNKEELLNEVIESIDSVFGDEKFAPFYPDFMNGIDLSAYKEFEDIVDEEILANLVLRVNQIVHYITGLTPEVDGSYFTSNLSDEDKEKFEIKLLKIEDVELLLTSILKSNISLSDQDYVDLTVLMDFFMDLDEIDDNVVLSNFSSIVIKETMVYVFDYLKSKNNIALSAITFKSATDVLRMICMMYGNRSLFHKPKPKFIIFEMNEKDVKLFLAILNNISQDKLIEDFLRNEKIWKQFFRKSSSILTKAGFNGLYISENFSNLKKAQNVLFNKQQYNIISKKGILEENKKKLDPNNILQSQLSLNKIVEIAPALGGEYARHIASILIRIPMNVDFVKQVFSPFENESLLENTNTRVLLQLATALKNLTHMRMSFVCPTNELPVQELPIALEKEEFFYGLVDSLMKGVLKKKYEKFIENDAAIMIPNEYKNIAVPTSGRLANAGFKTLPQFSKIKIDENVKTIIPFVRWQDNIDIDLSALFVGKNGDKLVSWNGNLQTSFSKHSGDIRNPRSNNDSIEYVGIDVDAAKSKYDGALVTAKVYDCVPFAQLNKTTSGVLFQENELSKFKFDLTDAKLITQPTQNAITQIFFYIDFVNMEVILIDSPDMVNVLGRRETKYVDFIKEHEIVFMYDFISLIAESNDVEILDVDYQLKEGQQVVSLDAYLALDKTSDEWEYDYPQYIITFPEEFDLSMTVSTLLK